MMPVERKPLNSKAQPRTGTWRVVSVALFAIFGLLGVLTLQFADSQPARIAILVGALLAIAASEVAHRKLAARSASGLEGTRVSEVAASPETAATTRRQKSRALLMLALAALAGAALGGWLTHLASVDDPWRWIVVGTIAGLAALGQVRDARLHE